MASSSALVFPSPSESPQYVAAPGLILVRTADEYTEQAEGLRIIKAFQARVVAFFAPHKTRAHALHAGLCAEEKKALQPALDHEARIKRALVAYTTEQDRIRRIEEQRLRAEQQRLDDERRLNEAAALELEAAATGDAGMREQAEQILAAPALVLPVVVATPAAPKIVGLSFRETYKAEVTDMRALVQAVASGAQPITLLTANQAALDGMARALKEALAIPGVRLIRDRVAASR